MLFLWSNLNVCAKLTRHSKILPTMIACSIVTTYCHVEDCSLALYASLIVNNINN